MTDLEERPHWVHVGQWRLGVGQLDGGDAERPHVTPDVIAVVVLLLTGDHLNTEIRDHHQQRTGMFTKSRGKSK